jgi:hypothetical protein
LRVDPFSLRTDESADAGIRAAGHPAPVLYSSQCGIQGMLLVSGRVLPPAIGIGLANYFSRKSREAGGEHVEQFFGADNEWLIVYGKEILEKEPIDYFIFGHRHLPIDYTYPSGARYINLGEWIRYQSYAVWDGENIELAYYPK